PPCPPLLVVLPSSLCSCQGSVQQGLIARYPSLDLECCGLQNNELIHACSS
ncbi:hypothetical protein LEMLEM_LOCUS10594, partial [Lemmus lemmus]